VHVNGIRRGFKAREFLEEQQAKGKSPDLEHALAHANALPVDLRAYQTDDRR
jgi:hypothetical protein